VQSFSEQNEYRVLSVTPSAAQHEANTPKQIIGKLLHIAAANRIEGLPKLRLDNSTPTNKQTKDIDAIVAQTEQSSS
jgi:hypothetical protein